MFKGYSITLILLAIFICNIISRIIMEIFIFLYDITWNWYKDKRNANQYIFKVIWFVLSIILLFSTLELSICIVHLIIQK